MYQTGKYQARKKHRKLFRIVLLALLISISFSGYLFIKDLMKPHVQLTQAAAKITTISYAPGKTKVINETNFSFSLPVSWEEVSHDTTPFNVYRFRSSDKDSTQRVLDIYEDKIQNTIAVNRVLAIESGTSRITMRGQVSDSCQDFTKGTPNGMYGTKAKWQGIDFLCDLTNYERNTVGTSSKDGIDIVGMIGSTVGSHNYFFLYTENSDKSDYGVLYSAIQSFTLK